MGKTNRRRTGLGLALGLGALAALAGGTRPASLEASECGGYVGPTCTTESVCVGWWIFKSCRETFTYYNVDAVDLPPDEGGAGPIGF